jgi:hypothetical protein
MADRDTISCHAGTSTWRKPTGTHDYRGVGRTEPGRSRPTWSACDVCGKSQAHRKHGSPWRTCSFCGSIHPEDLLARPEPDMMRSIDIGAGPPVDVPNVTWADWKYGYPHKLYLDYGPGLNAKFYSVHLLDRPDLIEAFNDRFGYLGVIFDSDSKGVSWKRSHVLGDDG